MRIARVEGAEGVGVGDTGLAYRVAVWRVGRGVVDVVVAVAGRARREMRRAGWRSIVGGGWRGVWEYEGVARERGGVWIMLFCVYGRPFCSALLGF